MDNGSDNDLFEDEFLSSQDSMRFEENSTSKKYLESKIFNDPIHGHIEVHPLLVKIIDTPQFQRLRNIKQLGANYFVYPGASHHRFEHCIGTCHLAGKLVKHLRSKQPNLKISDEDVLCVEIAALVHDLGHGPYSHMFDMQFLPRVRREKTIMHEETSCNMLEHLIEENELMLEFEAYGLYEIDIIFIKEMIFGPLVQSNCNGDISGWKYKGRPQSKSFLYEIVSNSRNKVDVDKWDYFARDCHHLGIKNSFNHNRFITFCRVLTVEGENPQICARDKEGFNLYEMFHTRSVLHRSAYQHRVSTQIDKMICDAMCLANEHISYSGKNGKRFSIADSVDDCVAFTKLTDSVFYEILNSSSEHKDMVKARDILNRVLKRKLYCFIGQTKFPNESFVKGTFENCCKMQKEIAEFDPGLQADDIVVTVKDYNYGMKEKNPCDNMLFYSKDNPDKPYMLRKEDVSEMLPGKFQDKEIQAFCKDNEKKELAKKCFKDWCEKKELRLPKNCSESGHSLTPMKRKDLLPHQQKKIQKLTLD